MKTFFRTNGFSHALVFGVCAYLSQIELVTANKVDVSVSKATEESAGPEIPVDMGNSEAASFLGEVKVVKVGLAEVVPHLEDFPGGLPGYTWRPASQCAATTAECASRPNNGKHCDSTNALINHHYSVTTQECANHCANTPNCCGFEMNSQDEGYASGRRSNCWTCFACTTTHPDGGGWSLYWKGLASDAPTKAPTTFPTKSPTTFPPTKAPTNAPTNSPTMVPTAAPTNEPTTAPTGGPCEDHTECAPGEKCKGGYKLAKKCRQKKKDCKRWGHHSIKRWGCAEGESCGGGGPTAKWGSCE